MIRCTSALMLACLLGFIESSVMRVFNSEGSPSENPTLFPLHQEVKKWLRDSGIHSGYAILKSVTWSVTFFDKHVEAGILGLPAGMLARFLRYAERMELFGPDLGMPHTRSMSGGLFELRIKAPGELPVSSIARLLMGGSSSCITS